MRIMLVDDSKNLRQVIRRYIEKHWQGVVFFEAGDGHEALQKLQEAHLDDMPIDVVILDWMMPKMTGFEFLKAMREAGPFKKIPKVIMLTAETYVDQMNAAIKYDVSSYLTKPFTDKELAEAIYKARLEIEEFKHAV